MSAPAGHSAATAGAAQLELVRRLESTWAGPGFDPLADRVLHRDPPGRGMGLLVVEDPAEIPTEELIRVGTGVLLDLVLEGRGPSTSRRRTARRRPAPVLAGAGFDALLTRSWAGRVQHGSGSRWRRFVELWASRDALPPSVDLARLAAGARGRRPVEVYVGSAAAAPEVPLSVESVDLVRRLNPFLGLHRPDPAPARARAVQLLSGGALRALPIPEPHRAWARRQAERLADQLNAGGYSVHGDLGEFVAGAQGRPMYREDVLDRLVEVLVTIMKEEQS